MEVELLAEQPSAMTHSWLPKREHERLGMTEKLIGLSVGIEDLSDILMDLGRALDRVSINRLILGMLKT